MAATYVPTKKGAILYSTIAGSGNSPSVIGSSGPSTAFNNINYQGIGLKNITILVSSFSVSGGPKMGVKW